MSAEEAALEFIYQNKCGLINEFDNKGINPEIIRKFELIGYIRKGVDSHLEKTWQITDLANDLYQSLYVKPTFIEKIKGYYYHFILNY